MKPIWEKGISKLYYAVKDEENLESLSYLIKEYHKNVSDNMINNERLVSQTIEEHCSSSVIIPILEGICEKEERYAVMQFRKNGLFLNDLIKNLEDEYGSGNIPLYMILEITGKILDSLAVFHEYEYKGEKEGYLHLDLNPGNIFFESAEPARKNWGNVKFIDFGSSVPVKEKNEILTKRSWSCSAKIYSSEEVIENLVFYINKASDLYSVCACMVRMLTGDSFTRIDTEQIPLLLKKYNPVFAFFLKNLIENACCEPSYYRYKDAREMKKDVELLLKCLSWMEEGKYYELLIHCYEESLPIELLSNNENIIKEKGILEALQVLKEDLTQNDVHYSKCLYIFEGLLALSKGKQIKNTRINTLLLECGLSCYNNTGQTRKAVELYKKKYSKSKILSIQEYITIQLRYAVSLADSYDFKKAYDNVQAVIQQMEAFKTTIKVAQMPKITELGRAYSAAGTYLAFLKKDNPLLWYQKALDEFDEDRGNSQITYSKILHYAIDKKNKELYEKYAKIYFDKKGFTPQKENLQKFTGKEYSAYEMFLYLKGIYTFYQESATQDFYEVLKYLITLENTQRKSHPEQLILKYSALLLYKHGEKEEGKYAFSKALKWVNQGRIQRNKSINIMMLMSYQTAWLSNELQGKDNENEQLLKQLYWQCDKFSWTRLKEKIEKEKNLAHILNHEYS